MPNYYLLIYTHGPLRPKLFAGTPLWALHSYATQEMPHKKYHATWRQIEVSLVSAAVKLQQKAGDLQEHVSKHGSEKDTKDTIKENRDNKANLEHSSSRQDRSQSLPIRSRRTARRSQQAA